MPQRFTKFFSPMLLSGSQCTLSRLLLKEEGSDSLRSSFASKDSPTAKPYIRRLFC